MLRVLIVAEHDEVRLNVGTARCVSCALQIAPGNVDIAVLAEQGDGAAAEASQLRGVTRVCLLKHAGYHGLTSAAMAHEIASLASSYTHLLAPSTTFGKDLLPRVAGLLGVGQISDVMAVESPYRFQRPIYAGNAIVTVEADPARTLIATVRTASFEPTEPACDAAPVQKIEPSAEIPEHTRFIALRTQRSDRPDLQSAARVVAGGRALGSQEKFKLVYELADRLGAAVGASRAAVDAGYVSNELQVGQTGKVIAPELYLAIGISGAIQHLTGIKDAGTIVAINRDADAPIFGAADIGLVADLFDAVPELIDELERRG